MNLTKRQEINLLRGQLDSEYQSFHSHYRELAENFMPRRARFQITDNNKGDKRNEKIFDTTPIFAMRTLQSGMMSGITSPARPWFRLSTPKKPLAEFGPVKNWLHDTTEAMRSVFLRSNLYNALPNGYGDLGTFGTSPIIMEEDFDDVVRFYTLPIGSYRLANNSKLKVDTFYREFRLTVRQVIEKFARDERGEIDWSVVSLHVKHLYEQGHTEKWIDVAHLIRTNPDFNPKQLAAKNKKFSSCYFELGSFGSASQSNYMSNEGDKFLRESGYDSFPVLAMRWQTAGEDVYGTDCPGMVSLPDAKQLQLGEKKLLKAIDKMIDPPMKGPTHLRQQKASILPGNMTYTDERADQGGFRPVHEINFRLEAMENKQAQVRNRIQRGCFEDLFLMLAQSDRRQITAREIEERHEEKLLALGPVLEQLNQDLLDPLISNTFQIMLRQGLVPPPPEELNGEPIEIQYTSIMAQAQKLVGISGMERFMNFVSGVSANTQNPGLMDKVDSDQFIDEYGDALGVPPKIVRSDDAVAEMRAEQQKAMQAQQQAEQIAQGAKAAKDLSGASMEGDNVLSRMAQAGNPLPQVTN